MNSRPAAQIGVGLALGLLLAASTVAAPVDSALSTPAARSIAFDVDEGTWLSVDVAPDGRTLVFDLLGDLYLLPIEGGKATPLTRGIAWDAQPRFSPDGRRIAYTSDADGANNVWTIGIDGADARAVTNERFVTFQSPEWTPDGRGIVVGRETGRNFQELWRYAVSGGAGEKLDVGDDTSARGPAFGADPQRLYFAQAPTTGELEMSMPLWQVQVLDLRTRVVSPVSAEVGSGFRPALSPDGHWLVYGARNGTETGLKLRDLRTGDERWLALPIDRDHQEATANLDLLPGASFTPDSAALVVAFGGKLRRIDVASGRAQVIPFTVRVEREVGADAAAAFRVEEGPVRVRQIRTPRLSPDGRTLAFVALDRLWLADARALAAGRVAAPRRATTLEVGEFEPAWSPDGRHVAFVTWSEREGGHVWRIRADGRGAPERLSTVPGYYSALEYAPDGDRLVVMRAPWRHGLLHTMWSGSAPAGLELAWLPAAGGEPRTIMPTRIAAVSLYDFGYSGQSRPHFGPESDRIYLYDVRDGLVSVRFDGTDRRVHLRVRGPAYEWVRSTPAASAPHVQIAPDGRRAIVELTDRHLYLLEIPRGANAGEAEVELDVHGAPAKRITTLGGYDARWSADGTALDFALGASAFRYRIGHEPRDADDQGEERRVRLEVPRERARGELVLRGARLITMRGDEVIESGDVVIRDNRIVALGARGSVAIPAGARVIDVGGRTIMPGLVDVHAHMGTPPGIHTSQPWPYLANLAYGVTTTLDPYNEIDDFTYEDLAASGAILGPRTYSTGPGITTIFGKQARDREDVDRLLRRYRDYYGVRHVKQYLFGDRREQQWFIDSARRYGLLATTEGGTTGFKWNLTQIADGYPRQEHNLTWPLYEDVKRFLLATGVSHSSQLQTLRGEGGPSLLYRMLQQEDVLGDAKLLRYTPAPLLDAVVRRRRWAFDERELVHVRWARDIGELIRRGGRAALGNHGNMTGLGTHWEMWLLAEGMPKHDVLRMATLFGAEHIGLAADLGSLEPGKVADLLVLDGNPLEDIRATAAIRWIVKDGAVYEGATLDRVWPSPKPLPPVWWASIGGAPASSPAPTANR